VMHKISA